MKTKYSHNSANSHVDPSPPCLAPGQPVPDGWSPRQSCDAYKAWWQRADVESVRQILASGMDVNVRDEDGVSLLHRAACLSEPSVLEFLIESGADIESCNRWGQTPLFEASGENMLILIDANADINKPDNQGLTPLHWVAYDLMKRRGDELKWLIDHGADVQVVDQNGFTALHLACRPSLVVAAEYVDDLLAAKADINARDRVGRTPLHYARDERIIEVLVGGGADMNALDEKGRNVLHYAVMEGVRLEVIQLLVDSGVDMQVRDVEHKMPLDYIEQRIELLKKERPYSEEQTDVLMGMLDARMGEPGITGIPG